eukprot:CAMPEP_0184861450 /NCGR_PEP_ID=MMETSP0580-20130426/6134_1 /TAXON_ID=1118495 /ORGANISM="Dactyliosolen fragilissimus" /LENGTH=264 /DNA_ID=CAMNT_0027358959 /DNA_START=140 /DNA_END=934 /DNA_ORIENTATION=+
MRIFALFILSFLYNPNNNNNSPILLVKGDTTTDGPSSAPSLAPWGGCNHPARNGPILRLRKTLICFTIGPGGDWAEGVSNVRYTFEPMADDYSRFTIPGSFVDIVENGSLLPYSSNITVHASSQSSLSFLKTYYDSVNEYIFPHLTAIIDVQKGIVKGIAWDKSCIFCGKDRCEENTYFFNGTQRVSKDPTKGCYLTRSECFKIAADGGTECDLTLYVVWTGDDRDGKALTSSSSRFSSFQPKQLQDFLMDSIPKINWPDWPWQ